MVIKDFVLEDGEVKCKSKSDWVAGVQVLGECISLGVSLQGTILDFFDLTGVG